jgi:Transglutaminase-like superfamily
LPTTSGPSSTAPGDVLAAGITKLQPVGRFHPANLRAAAWAFRTARRTRRLLDAKNLDAALSPPPPPPLPAEAARGVRGALRRQRESCLVNAIVRQAWDAAHGQRRDLVIGTTAPDDFRAHAWLEGDPVPVAEDELDASELDISWADGRATNAPKEPTMMAVAEGDGTMTAFRELLRRPAPHYGGARLPRVR